MTREEKRQRNEAMRAFKAEGHSVPEVAERFGVCYETARRECSGIAPQRQRKPIHPRNKWTGKYDGTEDGVQSAENIERIKAMIAERTPSFEYAGNYTGSDGFIDLRCKTCGKIHRKTAQSVRKSSARCEACYRAEIEAARAEKKGRKKAEAEERKARRKAEAEQRRKDRQASIVVKKQEVFVVCKECGSMFAGDGRNRAYCSPECAKKAQNNHRDRRLKGKVRDADITLQRVFNRDAGRCYLCGGLCDWNDITTREGTMIAGGTYPSIDHVVPIARGGVHSWENVRLAHRICNTLKSDTPL